MHGQKIHIQCSRKDRLRSDDLPPLVIPLKNIQYYFYSGKDEVA